MRRGGPGAALALALALAGAALAGDTLADPECPLMPWEPARAEIFVDQGGARTHFCCDRCRRDWLRADSPELAAQDAGKGGWMGALGRLHPLSVHFPIALLMLGALAELLFLMSRRDFFREGARFCTLFGALSAPPAALLGWCAGGFATFPGDLSNILWLHKWSGTALALLAVVTGILSERCPTRERPDRVRLYRVALFASAFLVAVVGFLGGQLVYGPDPLGL